MTTTIDIKLDKINNRYIATINPDGPQSFTSDLQYTSKTELFAPNWNSIGYVYDEAIVWDGQVWRKKSSILHPDTFYKQKGYYVVKYSGSGYAQYGGTKLADGYQIHYIISDGTKDIRVKAEENVQAYLNRSKRLCEHNSWINMEPAPRNPQIWTDGPHYEILDFSKAYDGLKKYKCESAWNNILCSEWNYSKLTPGENVPCWK